LETVLKPGGRFVISLRMLLASAAGRCYSLSEIRNWLERAGLRRAHPIALRRPLTSSLVISGQS
jgi:hypothetical protein